MERGGNTGGGDSGCDSFPCGGAGISKFLLCVGKVLKGLIRLLLFGCKRLDRGGKLCVFLRKIGGIHARVLEALSGFRQFLILPCKRGFGIVNALCEFQLFAFQSGGRFSGAFCLLDFLLKKLLLAFEIVQFGAGCVNRLLLFLIRGDVRLNFAKVPDRLSHRLEVPLRFLKLLTETAGLGVQPKQHFIFFSGSQKPTPFLNDGLIFPAFPAQARCLPESTPPVPETARQARMRLAYSYFGTGSGIVFGAITRRRRLRFRTKQKRTRTVSDRHIIPHGHCAVGVNPKKAFTVSAACGTGTGGHTQKVFAGKFGRDNRDSLCGQFVFNGKGVSRGQTLPVKSERLKRLTLKCERRFERVRINVLVSFVGVQFFRQLRNLITHVKKLLPQCPANRLPPRPARTHSR